MKYSAFGNYRTKNDRGNRRFFRWLDLVLGLLLGFALGLSIAWGVAPNTQADPSPAALRADYQDGYRLLVAKAYTRSGDLGRALVRLSLLKDPDPVQTLLDLAQRSYSPTTQQSALSLTMLAEAIQVSQQPIPSPFPTATTSPAEPTVTMVPFALFTRETICDPEMVPGYTRILVQGNSGQPMPGISIRIAWNKDAQSIITGLKPELGDGYADFIMLPDTLYTIQIQPSSEDLSGISIPECADDEDRTYGGGYLFVFRQP